MRSTSSRSCADGEALLASVDANPPDVVITDIRMPPCGDDEGIRVAGGCARRIPRSA